MLYVHTPYCHQKCSYCAFYSKADTGNMEQYVAALCREIEGRRSEQHAPVKTIYFGGGTPTLLPISLLRRVVDTIRQNYDTSELEECTIEGNPEDFNERYLTELHRLGFFNRVSIGVQSFDDHRLRMLNRRHSALQARQAVALTANAGFENISIDLIYGQPAQSPDDWRQELDTLRLLADRQPQLRHISAYALTVEDGTILHKLISQGKVTMPDEEVVLQHYAMLQQWVAEQGFEQYEISNYCRHGAQSRHNSRYWNRTPYLGFGPAAHSFVIAPGGTQCRRWNIADTAKYISAINSGQPYSESETLTAADIHNEYLMTALRTPQGIEKQLIAPQFRTALSQAIQPYLRSGLIAETPTHYMPTPQGLLQADGMAANLFID